MDTAQWPQVIGLVKPLEELISNTCTKHLPTEKRTPRLQKEQTLNCPRCNSTNTKFCYYNNYSLTQPRYFCKTCRRYWTEGGSLRNVPVGGGSRKNKRSSTSSSSAITSSSSSTPSSKKLHDPTPQSCSEPSSQNPNPKLIGSQDLNLAFSTSQDYHSISEFVELPKIENSNNNITSSSTTSSSLSALEFLRTGITSRGTSITSFMPMPIIDSNTIYSPGYALQDFKPTLNFGVDGLGGSTYGGLQVVQGSASRILFPFEDVKQVSGSSNHGYEQINRGQGDSNGNWSGVLGGGPW